MLRCYESAALSWEFFFQIFEPSLDSASMVHFREDLCPIVDSDRLMMVVTFGFHDRRTTAPNIRSLFELSINCDSVAYIIGLIKACPLIT